MKWTGFERKKKVTFLRLFDNPLSKYLGFKIIYCMKWLFWVIYQNYRGLGLAFAAYFLYDFSIKMFFTWYSIYAQSFNVIPFFLLKISNKMHYKVLILTTDDVMNFKIYLDSKKSFLDEIKSIFHSFWRTIIRWKNQNLMKIADASFK